MTACSTFRNIPLDKLVLSPANVRKTPATATEDAELEASIRAKGILQNLVVHPSDDGLYEVDAGGRRLKILQKLAAEGVIDTDAKVPCKIEQAEDAVETSLMQNTIRAAMHPADEFVAMAAHIDAGAGIDDVAKRFGVSERHVKQRLRLGKLAPELLDAYRAGAINLDAVTAFTLGADHNAQLAVWNQLKHHSYIQPYTVKRLLTESAVPLDSDLGLFVGAGPYEAAGGTITRDLFSGDDDGFMDDGALVHRLAIEKLEAKAEELRTEWAWTKAVLDPQYRMLAQYARVEPKPAKVPAELSAELERIEQRLGELEHLDPDVFTEELAAEGDQLEERRAQIDTIVDGLAAYTKKDRKRAGVIVTIGEQGDFCLHQGLIERSAVNSPARSADHGDSDDGRDDAFAPGSGDDDDQDFAASQRVFSASIEQALRKELGFSQSLVDDLKAHRHQITRAHLAVDFEVAFDLALYALCVDVADHLGYRSRPLDLRAVETVPRSSMNDLAGTAADHWLTVQKQVLELDWLKLKPEQGFAALVALPVEEKQRLFAWCIAATLKPQLAIEDSADPVIEAVGRRLAIAFEDYWRPTADNYWGRVKKAHGLEIGRQILGERWARDHTDDKKPVLAAALEVAFDPQKSSACVSLNQTARDNAAAWMPPGMAFDTHAIAASSENSDAGEHRATDGEDGEAGDPGTASADLPAFLTEDDQVGAPNGASPS